MKPTYAVGHLALGYLIGRTSGKLLKLRVNPPLLFLASIMPDVDLFIPGVEHRGPTHSILLTILVFIPIFIYSRKKGISYFLALAQHALIGDYLAGGGVQLLWPLNPLFYYNLTLQMASLLNILLEWTFFLVCFIVMIRTMDAWTLLQPHRSNLILSVPLLAVLLPTFLSLPLHVPLVLVIPHLAYLVLFVLSIAVGFRSILAEPRNAQRGSESHDHGSSAMMVLKFVISSITPTNTPKSLVGIFLHV